MIKIETESGTYGIFKARDGQWHFAPEGHEGDHEYSDGYPTSIAAIDAATSEGAWIAMRFAAANDQQSDLEETEAMAMGKGDGNG